MTTAIKKILSRAAISVLAGTFLATTGFGAMAWTGGQESGEPPQTVNGMSLSDYLGSQEYWQALTGFAGRFEQVIGPCANPQINSRAKAVPAKIPYRVPKVGIVPQWIEILNIEGCEQPFKRMVVTFLINGKPVFMPLLHGSTRADPYLQADVMKVLLPHARAQASKNGCPESQGVRSVGTEFIQDDGDVPGTRWVETWNMSDCHGTHTYGIRFTATQDGGTTFVIKLL